MTHFTTFRSSTDTSETHFIVRKVGKFPDQGPKRRSDVPQSIEIPLRRTPALSWWQVNREFLASSQDSPELEIDYSKQNTQPEVVVC